MHYTLMSLAAALLFQLGSAKPTTAQYFYRSDRPLVMGHRGDSGHAPEGTLAAFADAYYGGADFLEMDLHVTKDGQLVVSHDANLAASTTVDEENAIDGRWNYLKRIDGSWNVIDFTLAELKQLSKVQRYDTRSPLLDEKYAIATLDDVIMSIQSLDQDQPRSINSQTKVGLYIELKDYDGLLGQGYDTAQLLVDRLHVHGLQNIDAASPSMPIIIQSFQPNALLRAEQLTNLPLVLLLSTNAPAGTYDYAQISTFANGVGAPSQWIMTTQALEGSEDDLDAETEKEKVLKARGGKKNNPPDPEPEPEPTNQVFVQEMHDNNLAIHSYTLRNDQLQYTSSIFDEIQLYIEKGVDGIFADYPHSLFAISEHIGTSSLYVPQN